MLAKTPENPQTVKAVRSEAKDGDVVTVAGWVGGSTEPIAQNRAIFTLLDGSVPSCKTGEMEECKTPWDSCCEPSDVLASNSIAVQVLDDNGAPLRTSLKNVNGMQPMKEVVVVGNFSRSADGKAATIDATGLYVGDEVTK